MKILVSGASGYIGTWLIPQLLRDDHQVLGILGPQSAIDEMHGARGYETVSADELADAFDFGPDVVVHLAASTIKNDSPDAASVLVDANVVFATKLAALSLERRVQQFVNISTYSTSTNGNTYSPQTLYAATKMAFEDILLHYQLGGLNSVTLAFYDIYGPGQSRSSFLKQLVDCALSSAEFQMSHGEQEICFLNVRDAVSAVIHTINSRQDLLGRKESRFSVLGPETFRVRDVPDLFSEWFPQFEFTVHSVLPYRDREIFTVSPLSPPLPDWQPQWKLRSGLEAIIRSLT